jgi:SpoVK/Ycf46/Vps4 family AAA+-type ATPase
LFLKGDPQQRVRRSAIEDTIISKGCVRFQDIAGLSDAKEALREAIIIPLLFPHLFTGNILHEFCHVDSNSRHLQLGLVFSLRLLSIEKLRTTCP